MGCVVRVWPALRGVLILTPAVALVAAGVVFVARQFDGDEMPPPPDVGGRLVVVVVFDQLRGDYLERWSKLFGPAGFEKLKAGGVWYSDAHIPYAVTTTGPGHASLSTGRPPSVHGIVDNAWFDRGRGKAVNCAIGDRGYDRVPSHGGPDPSAGGGQSPDRLLTSTVGDELVASHAGRVFSLALKDRAAVLMGGKTPTGAFWFDAGSGQFVTSSYYRDRLPPWAEAFNASKPAARLAGHDWTRLLDPAVYEVHAGPDAGAGEGAANLFPHVIPAVVKSFDAVVASPAGNELLWEFAQAAVEAEGLGQRGGTDLLMLGFSANDFVGHAYGPDSQEVLDMTVRSDKLLGEIVASLTEKFGADRLSFVLSADHGVCPLPERAVATHPDARRFDPVATYAPLSGVLDARFGRGETPGQWVERIDYPWIYLNQRHVAAMKLDRAAVERVAADWAGHRPEVAAVAFPREVLAGPPSEEPFARAAQLSFHPDRSGDVYLVAQPYCNPGGKLASGTTHGTPHPYDTHVPILAFGANVPQLGEQSGRVSSLLVAPIVARCLGLAPPLGLPEKLPAEWGAPPAVSTDTPAR